MGDYGYITNVTDENNGKANTEALVAINSDNKAAIACSLYTTEGTKQGEWYLPASKEFEDIQWNTNKDVIQASLNSLYYLGSIARLVVENATYWSSTEYDSNSAFNLNTANGNLFKQAKYSGIAVRAFCEL